MSNVSEWLARVAFKKIAYTIGKAAAGFLAYTKVTSVMNALGIQADPAKFQEGAAAFVLAGLEALHDWLNLRFPDSKWL